MKKHVDDPNLSTEERFEKLQDHHIKETTFLLDKCRQLAVQLKDYNDFSEKRL